ncbi:hypothetical protein [Actinoplanes sp. NPDC020271]|uniref:hypothetical protein n=1 Tax=Actinoplanes sp. NPDC020271 TaxID=3363896 RepID=UPI00379B2193
MPTVPLHDSDDGMPPAPPLAPITANPGEPENPGNWPALSPISPYVQEQAVSCSRRTPRAAASRS